VLRRPRPAPIVYEPGLIPLWNGRLPRVGGAPIVGNVSEPIDPTHTADTRPLTARVALVTGATRGIGLAIAEALGREGASLALASRSLHLAEALAARLEKAYRVPTVAIELDVTKPPSVENMAEKLLKRFSRIDIVVNNAGVMHMDQLLGASIADFTETIGTNLGGPFLVARALVDEMMLNRRGHIINMAAMAGLNGAPYLSAYCASKAGLISLTQSWAEELAEYGIKVLAVCPDVVDTETTAALVDISRVAALAPEEVARAVVELITQDTAETGAVIQLEATAARQAGSETLERDA
jgi:NAD(P)-dependent dehydrogenase (short-subunit alcohol dehydrogenase family)